MRHRLTAVARVATPEDFVGRHLLGDGYDVLTQLRSVIRRLRLNRIRRIAVVTIFCAIGGIAPLVSGQSLDEARSLYRAGRIDEAIDAFRAVAKREEPVDSARAASARNNACVLLMNQGEHRAALVECRESLRLRQDVDDDLRLARTLNNLGLVLQDSGEYRESEQRYLEALAINERIGVIEAQVVNRGNLGLLATLRGRYDEALHQHDRALELCQAHADQPWSSSRLRIARTNVGVTLERLGEFRRALEEYQRALDEGGSDDSAQDASLRLNMGVIYRNLGDPVRALAAFTTARTIYAALGADAALSNTWLNIGLVQHRNLRDPDQAEQAYRRALELARDSGDRTEEVQILFHQGGLLVERNRFAEAVETYQACLELAEKIDSPEGRWSALEGLGRVAEAQGQLEQALSLFEKAIEEIERIRADIHGVSDRAGYFADKRAVYVAAVRVLGSLDAQGVHPGASGKALAVAQRVKARELVESLGGLPSVPVPLDANEIVRSVRGELVLEYLIGESNIYLWIVDKVGVDMFDLGASDKIVEAVDDVHRSLSDGRAPSATTLQHLSHLLVGELDPARIGERLYVAPDGRLHYLPFDLLSPLGQGPLVETVAVAYLPSASAMNPLFERAPSASKVSLAGMANPSMGSLPDRFDLPNLPASVMELESISKLFPGDRDVRTDKGATESAFRELAANGAKVMHLATHSIVDEAQGRGAAVVLTAQGLDDGLLYPAEIAALDYDVTLTVLASCRTAIGSNRDGRAMSSLTGSFLTAGSSGVVATLWDVGDQATQVFMEQFYYHLGRGLSPLDALQRAKQRLRSDPDWAHPSVWAAYVLVGRSPPVAPSSRWYVRWAWTLLAALVGIFLVFGLTTLVRRFLSGPAAKL